MARTSRRVTLENQDLWFAPGRLEKPLSWPRSEPSPPPRYRLEPAGVFLEARDPEGEMRRVKVAAVFGSGHRGFTPLALGEEGGIRELRVTFLNPKDHWILTPGAAGDPEPLGSVKSHESSLACLSCHTTVLSWKEARLDLERSVFGIGCERCHGPGSAHVEIHFKNKDSLKIFNPGSLRRREQVEFCGQCHRRPEDLEPGDALARDPGLARHAGASLMLSACFRRSPPASTITCLDCHSPHRNIDRGRDDFNRPCRRCHDNPPSQHQSVKIAESSDCVACHMKVETEGFFGLAFTDHWIRIPASPSPLDTPGRKEYAHYLESSYRAAMARPGVGPEKSSRLRLRLGTLLHMQASTKEGLGWLRQALSFSPLYKDRILVAEIHERAGMRGEAIEILEETIRLIPEHNRAYYSLARIHLAAGRLGLAKKTLEAWGEARPGDPLLEETWTQVKRLERRQ
ncbi:MAG: tetratricopeptide repeat protein [Planctomycetes bacterium]|nr:tetratricopeptide repeat protein [Planctomycetota bacterium]